MTVLVTGARWDVGRAVLARLAADAEPVRASSRDAPDWRVPRRRRGGARRPGRSGILAGRPGVQGVPIRASRRRVGVRGGGAEGRRGAR
jgi:uncharacterized protein YbjT (DUF2867 family)